MVCRSVGLGPPNHQFTTHLPCDRVPLESQFFSLNSTLLPGPPKIIQESPQGSKKLPKVTQIEPRGLKIHEKVKKVKPVKNISIYYVLSTFQHWVLA